MYVLYPYNWGLGDTVWHVASRHLERGNWSDVPTFVTAIWAINPNIDWRAIPLDSVIYLPFWQITT